jgi:hypothetical protein
MGKAYEMQLRAIMRSAAVRNKGLLLLLNVVEKAIGRDPILTESEIYDIQQSLTESERRECATILKGSLSSCIMEVEHIYESVMNRLNFLNGYFSLAAEYRQFECFLNELCLKKNKSVNTRLQERLVSIGSSDEFSYNIAIQEESDGSTSIYLELSDDDRALIAEVTQDVMRELSELKTVTQVVKDVIRECNGLIDSAVESVKNLENSVQACILLTKGLLFNIDSDTWSEERALLVQDSDPLLSMMEALVDYDDIAINEALYTHLMFSVRHEITIA